MSEVQILSPRPDFRIVGPALLPRGDPHVFPRSPVRQQPRVVRASAPQRSGVLSAPFAAAAAAVPVDRLRGQPRARERDRRPPARRALRPSQRRERRRPQRPELPFGDAVRGRRAATCGTSSCAATTAAAACRRRCWISASAWPTTGCATCRTCMRSTTRASRRSPRCRSASTTCASST